MKLRALVIAAANIERLLRHYRWHNERWSAYEIAEALHLHAFGASSLDSLQSLTDLERRISAAHTPIGPHFSAIDRLTGISDRLAFRAAAQAAGLSSLVGSVTYNSIGDNLSNTGYFCRTQTHPDCTGDFSTAYAAPTRRAARFGSARRTSGWTP